MGEEEDGRRALACSDGVLQMDGEEAAGQLNRCRELMLSVDA